MLGSCIAIASCDHRSGQIGGAAGVVRGELLIASISIKSPSSGLCSADDSCKLVCVLISSECLVICA